MKLAEDILIGTWLRGEHLDDLPHVEPKHFENSAVVRDLKNGLPTISVYQNHPKLSPKLAEWSSISTPALYDSAYMALTDYQIRKQIEAEADLDKVADLLAERKTRFSKPVEPFSNLAVAFVEEMDRREHQELIKWEGMPSLQESTIGIKRKELTTIAARPSVGKSAFALQVAFGAWRQGAKVLYFPLEMSAIQTSARILIREGYVLPKETQTGIRSDLQKFMVGVDLLKEIEESKRFLIYEGEGQQTI